MDFFLRDYGNWFDHRDADKWRRKAIGKIIASVGLTEKELTISFEDGSRLLIMDDMQNCCEYRYMHSDDLPSDYFNGAKLTGVEVRDGGSRDGKHDEYDDLAFLVVETSRGAFTVETHNEHNGYYGGFDLVAIYEQEEQQDEPES